MYKQSEEERWRIEYADDAQMRQSEGHGALRREHSGRVESPVDPSALKVEAFLQASIPPWMWQA
jgi:hypothetical protein